MSSVYSKCDFRDQRTMAQKVCDIYILCIVLSGIEDIKHYIMTYNQYSNDKSAKVRISSEELTFSLVITVNYTRVDLKGCNHKIKTVIMWYDGGVS